MTWEESESWVKFYDNLHIAGASIAVLFLFIGGLALMSVIALIKFVLQILGIIEKR